MARMELIAGDARDILVVLSASDGGAGADGSRFAAYLPLGGGIDPTWLDLFAESVRMTLGTDGPVDFIDARYDLGAEDAGLIVERIDPGWITAIARLPDARVDAVTGRWIDRLDEEYGALPREEKPWIRDLANQIVAFCRTADAEPDVVFVWSLV
jgi:hypothetical protein